MGYYWIILLLPAFFDSSHGDCGAPPNLVFGALDQEFDKDSFPVGATVTYSCRPGFVSVPQFSKVLTCLSNSTWSTPEEFCTRRSCQHPGDIENGEVSIIDTLFGSRVNYTCNPGYHMLSKINYRICQADGKWSNEVPVCEVQKCAPPHAITDGFFRPEKDEYDYQDAVIYACNKNLALIGESSLFCTAFGNWSSDPPQCKVVECESPDVPNSKKLYGFSGPYTFNYAVGFECLSGYTMIGAPSVKCNATSEWEPPLPVCSSRSCSHPGDIAHGQIQANNFLFGSKVNYTCNSGYSMISKRNDRECQADGTWSGKPPVCKELVCDQIYELQEEARQCNSNPDEWIKYLQVQYLYLQIENLKLDIEIKKRQLASPSQTSPIVGKS